MYDGFAFVPLPKQTCARQCVSALGSPTIDLDMEIIDLKLGLLIWTRRIKELDASCLMLTHTVHGQDLPVMARLLFGGVA